MLCYLGSQFVEGALFYCSNVDTMLIFEKNIDRIIKYDVSSDKNIQNIYYTETESDVDSVNGYKKTPIRSL